MYGLISCTRGIISRTARRLNLAYTLSRALFWSPRKLLKSRSICIFDACFSELPPIESIVQRLGDLIGGIFTSPRQFLFHTSVVFEAKAAVASVLGHSRSSVPGNGDAPSANRTRQ